MAKHFLMHQFAENFEQIDEMEKFKNYDAGCIQISSHSQTNTESSTKFDATLRIEAFEDADKVSWTTMAQNKHENH